MKEYGTKIAAGVTPGKGGKKVEGIPVYDSVAEAVSEHAIDASVFFVPALFVKETVYETIEAGIGLIVVITEHVPVHDAMAIREAAEGESAVLIGPTTPGIITPGEAKLGIMPGNLFQKGYVGIISRSGTLAYETAGVLTEDGLGQSTVVGMGADPVVFTGLTEILALFEADRDTHSVIILGEVGGAQEETAAEYIRSEMNKPVFAYIAGKNVPEGKRMGHAGAIIERGSGTYRSKYDTIQAAGVPVAGTPSELVGMVREVNNEKL